MRSYEVLKTFKYSPDGIKVIDLKKGDTDGINDGDIGNMIKAGYVKEVDSKKAEPDGNPPHDGDPDEPVADNEMLLALDKDDIEKILRHYGFALDKRKSLKSARDEMMKQVLMGKPENPEGESNAKYLASFYAEHFGVKMEWGDKTVDDLAVEMAAVLESAFSVGE